MNIREYFAIFSVCLAAIFNPVETQAAGARLVTEINPGSVGSYPSNFTQFGGNLYFSAYTQSNGFELWQYNGTSVRLAADVNPTVDDIGFGVKEGNDSVPDWMTALGGYLYFSAFEPRRGTELWRFDGAQAERVSDINPDANDTIKFLPGSSWPKELTVVNNALYFSATSRTNPENYELWRYDGATISQAANLRPDIGADFSSYPNGLTAFNGALYFMADDGAHGWELYRHSGSAATLIDIHPGGPESSSYPKYFTGFGTSLYFQAYTAESGFELWRTDGTGATMVTDLNPGAASSYPEGLTLFQGALYFSGNNGASGAELQRLEATTVTLAADVNIGGDAYPKNLFVFGDLLVFSANDGVHGWELWKFDGTVATLVTDLNTAGDAFPQNFTASGGALYFTATTPETGYEIFKFNGTSVTLAGDVNPGPGDSFPRFLVDFNNQLYFSAARDGASNWELWVLEEGTHSNAAPAVTMTAPGEGATFLTTDSIMLSADATDDGGIVQVEFMANGNLVGSDSTAPYSVTAILPAGSYSLTAKAIDNGGAVTTSAAVTISISPPNQPPGVSLSAPADGATYRTPDMITFSADATDDGSVTQVEFLANGNILGTDTDAPYNTSTTLAAGSYVLTARATDNAGLSTTSSSIMITVMQTTENQQPAVVLTSPQTGQVLLAPGTVKLEATASDADGTVMRVEFFKDQQSIGSDPSAPFEIELGNLEAGMHRFTAIAIDNLGASGASSMIEVRVAAQPSIANITRTGATLNIEVAARDGDTVILEASEDLVNWQFVASSSSVSGMVTFTQPVDMSARFYRVAVP